MGPHPNTGHVYPPRVGVDGPNEDREAGTRIGFTGLSPATSPSSVAGLAAYRQSMFVQRSEQSRMERTDPTRLAASLGAATLFTATAIYGDLPRDWYGVAATAAALTLPHINRTVLAGALAGWAAGEVARSPWILLAVAVTATVAANDRRTRRAAAGMVAAAATVLTGCGTDKPPGEATTTTVAQVLTMDDAGIVASALQTNMNAGGATVEVTAENGTLNASGYVDWAAGNLTGQWADGTRFVATHDTYSELDETGWVSRPTDPTVYASDVAAKLVLSMASNIRDNPVLIGQDSTLVESTGDRIVADTGDHTRVTVDRTTGRLVGLDVSTTVGTMSIRATVFTEPAEGDTPAAP